MCKRILIPAALGLALVAVPAGAQNTGTPGTPGNVITPGAGVNTGPLQFQPGVGFVPGNQLGFSPFGTNFGNGFNALGQPLGPFSNRVPTAVGAGVSPFGFFNGFPVGTGFFGGAPFFGGPYGTAAVQPVYVPVPVPVDENGNPVQVNQSRRRATVPTELVPTASGNATRRGYMGPGEVVAPRYTGSETVSSTGRGGNDVQRVDQRVAGSRQEQRMSPAEERTIQRMQNMMLNDRPLREGTVQRVGATGVTVQYTAGTQTRTDRFPMHEVFFFQDNGDIASAESEPELVQTGVRVLVPVSTRASAIENRTRIGNTVITEPGTSRAVTVPSERVAGSRQTTPKKAPARKR
jgi:hypothetical protein